ncbi:MAG: glycoside hydrolase family 28 protein [Verrucomicrobia bacterium]|nr:glycoside hydrolase family 28 protein [Verrucomicrobiota bacterium]
MKNLFSLKKLRRAVCILSQGVFFLSVSASTVVQAEKTVHASVAASFSFSESEAILARIKAPVFAARDFAISDFGAVAGTDASAAIRKAIAACNAAGGGRVVVPEGEWLTGAIHLKSNVNLYLAKGATLRFSTDPAAYLPVVQTRWEGIECMNYSPFIYAWEQENIAVTGEGTLDGSAGWDNWWSWAKRGADTKSLASADVTKLNEYSSLGVPVTQRVFGAGHYLRPSFFQPYRCRNVLIEGVTLLRSPMWEVTPVLCTNVIVRKVKINSHGPNNDGCDPDSCRDVLIEDCVFDTGDDCIAIKSGRNEDGRRIGVPSENLIIRNCEMKDGHGGVVIGSEVAGGCRNVFVENCKMDSPNLDRGLRFKSNARRGGLVENVYMRNVKIGRVAEAILTVDHQYEEGARGEHQPIVRNVVIENVTSLSSPRVMWIAGIPKGTIDNILFKDCTFSGIDTAEVVQNAGRIAFENVTVTPLKKARSLNSRPDTE